MSEYVQNEIVLSISETEPPSLVINGVEVAGAITSDWKIEVGESDGVRAALLTVTYPVYLP